MQPLFLCRKFTFVNLCAFYCCNKNIILSKKEKMSNPTIIIVKNLLIAVLKIGNEDFISLTDIARNKNTAEPKDVVKNWMRSRFTIEFLGLRNK